MRVPNEKRGSNEQKGLPGNVWSRQGEVPREEGLRRGLGEPGDEKMKWSPKEPSTLKPEQSQLGALLPADLRFGSTCKSY